MIQMINKISTWFQIGNNTQNNTVLINPKIDVTLKRIEKDFSGGNFKQAVEDLDKLITDNSSEDSKSVKYQLLLIKADFLMQFRNINDFKELLDHIEKEYKTFIDTKFKELKLTLFALTNNQEFFELSKQMRLETPNSLSQRHLDIVFYLNSRDVERAKELFEEEIKITQSRNKLLLIGGHIYSNLYRDDKEDISIFNNADMYYKELLETEKISFLDKMQIQGFYAITLLNKKFQNKIVQNTLLFSVLDYKNSLDIVLENGIYFSPEYIKILVENYSYIFSYLRQKDEYNGFYKKYENDLSIKHYIHYCTINEIQLDHQKIQESILKNPQLDDLLIYTSLVLHDSALNSDEIIKFMQSNKKFIYEHSSIVYNYVKAYILQDKEIDTEIFKYLEDNRHRDLNILVAYIESNLYIKKQISDVDIAKLIEFSLAEDVFFIRILHVIKLLQQLGKRKDYLDLALTKQNVFVNIIFETLKICYEDENLLFQDFEFFVGNIAEKDSYNSILGDIYAKFDRLDIAFNYYYLEYKKNDNLVMMLTILQVVADYYHKSHHILEETKQREVFNALIAKEKELNLESLIFLLSYALHILKDTRQILPLLNQKLLNTDIENLNNALKIQLSDIYMTQYGLNNKEMFLYELNLCLVQNGKKYIKNTYSVAEVNQKKFGFIAIDANEYFLKKQDNTYKEESLFHKIVGVFAFKCENPSLIPITFDQDSENPLSDFFAFMDEQASKTKELFQRYSDNIPVGLYALANDDYKNYFTLIPYLLNNQSINFNSLHVNYVPKETKKILTLSSIVLLHELNQLDAVLQRDDIVIQQTVVNWLQEYFAKINCVNMPRTFTYLNEAGHEFVPLTENSIEEATKFKAFVLSLLTRILKCTIINDVSENLPLKEAKILGPLIGIQEYQALAYCINHNYQIISENNIFDMLFETLKLNKGFISNTTVFLENILEYEKRRSLILDLHRKNYKYVLSANYANNLIAFMERGDVSNIKNEEKELIKIANGYGFLENIKKYYNDKFKVLFPKTVLPIKTFFDENIEKLLKIIEK
jgi:hypothetical protein